MPPTLGQRLKHAREARGLSVEDITHQTRIPAQRVRDLEEDRYTGSGSLTYAKSFLTSYAKLLGVDASSVLDHIQPPPIGGVRDYRYLVENHGFWVDDDSNTETMAPPRSMVPAPRSIGIAALICAVAGLLGVVLWNASATRASTTSAAKPAALPGKPEPSVVADLPPVNAQGGPTLDAKSPPEILRAHAADGSGVLPGDIIIKKQDPNKPIPKPEIVR